MDMTNETITVESITAAAVETAIAAFVARLQAASTAWMTRHASRVHPSRITRDASFKGRRFARIISEDIDSDIGEPNGQRAVVCFVELATGKVWKPKSFGTPVMNFPRGNVLALGNAWLAPDGTPLAQLPSY